MARIEPLGNNNITSYRGKDENMLPIVAFLINMKTSETIENVFYNKIGDMYFITGQIDFTALELDILPEPAIVDGFLMTDENEVIKITKDNTTLIAETLGTKTVQGFYVAN